MVLKVEDIRRPRGIKGKGKRKGRGIGSGKGKTSGKGHKGAKARSGGGTYNPGFEGGQMPLIRRLPKRGFTNKFGQEWSVVNVSTLQKSDKIEDGVVIDKELLLKTRILRKRALPYKILGKGKLSKTLTIKANAFSEGAIKGIEGAGGKAEIVKWAGVKDKLIKKKGETSV
ncbi:MAG: 50S ribosomal protein L15 [Candidatus Omnitrophica bacterium]|nr:50S ribosomal protein L15 [Candidatus Omnitrophota bacterium]